MRTFFLMLLGIVPLFAQNNGIDQPSDFVMPPTGGKFLRWYGKPGRTYFVQASSQAEPLQKWNWAPIIETGNNQDISHEVNGAPPRGFFRLKYTDDPIPTGKTPETADFDGDELDNYSEITSNPQTDPLNNDTDGDGLSDGLEVLYLLSDPTNQDSDGDGMPDQWEYWNGLNLILDDAADDTDLDGLTNLEEFNLGTSPYSSDTDYDNLPDGWEAINGLNPTDWNDATADSDADGVRNLEEYVLDFNPQSPTTNGIADATRDRDGDGIPDLWEALYGKWVGGTFSRTLDWDVADGAADLDKDGLTNLEEFNQGTKPNNFDSDGDNLPDKWEITYNIDPKISTEANGAAGDIEPDGVTNFDEFLHGTNPNLADTDGDGTSDLVEITQGSDPNDSTDAGTPPDDPLEDVVFKVGGDYASWRMEIQGMGPKDHRKLVVVSPKYNEWETKTHKLRKNNRYEVTLHHTGSKDAPNAPWYCWEARVEDKPSQQTFENYSPDRIQGVAEFFTISNGSWIVDNRDGLFTTHNDRYEQSGGNVAANLKAVLLPVGIKQRIPDIADNGGNTTYSYVAMPSVPWDQPTPGVEIIHNEITGNQVTLNAEIYDALSDVAEGGAAFIPKVWVNSRAVIPVAGDKNGVYRMANHIYKLYPGRNEITVAVENALGVRAIHTVVIEGDAQAGYELVDEPAKVPFHPTYPVVCEVRELQLPANQKITLELAGKTTELGREENAMDPGVNVFRSKPFISIDEPESATLAQISEIPQDKPIFLATLQENLQLAFRFPNSTTPVEWIIHQSGLDLISPKSHEMLETGEHNLAFQFMARGIGGAPAVSATHETYQEGTATTDVSAVFQSAYQTAYDTLEEGKKYDPVTFTVDGIIAKDGFNGINFHFDSNQTPDFAGSHHSFRFPSPTKSGVRVFSANPQKDVVLDGVTGRQQDIYYPVEANADLSAFADSLIASGCKVVGMVDVSGGFDDSPLKRSFFVRGPPGRTFQAFDLLYTAQGRQQRSQTYTPSGTHGTALAEELSRVQADAALPASARNALSLEIARTYQLHNGFEDFVPKAHPAYVDPGNGIQQPNSWTMRGSSLPDHLQSNPTPWVVTNTLGDATRATSASGLIHIDSTGENSAYYSQTSTTAPWSLTGARAVSLQFRLLAHDASQGINGALQFAIGDGTRTWTSQIAPTQIRIQGTAHTLPSVTFPTGLIDGKLHTLQFNLSGTGNDAFVSMDGVTLGAAAASQPGTLNGIAFGDPGADIAGKFKVETLRFENSDLKYQYGIFDTDSYADSDEIGGANNILLYLRSKGQAFRTSAVARWVKILDSRVYEWLFEKYVNKRYDGAEQELNIFTNKDVWLGSTVDVDIQEEVDGIIFRKTTKATNTIVIDKEETKLWSSDQIRNDMQLAGLLMAWCYEQQEYKTWLAQFEGGGSGVASVLIEKKHLLENIDKFAKRAETTLELGGEIAICMTNEYADYAITIKDVCQGDYMAIVGFIPLVPSSTARAFKFINKIDGTVIEGLDRLCKKFPDFPVQKVDHIDKNLISRKLEVVNLFADHTDSIAVEKMRKLATTQPMSAHGPGSHGGHELLSTFSNQAVICFKTKEPTKAYRVFDSTKAGRKESNFLLLEPPISKAQAEVDYALGSIATGSFQPNYDSWIEVEIPTGSYIFTGVAGKMDGKWEGGGRQVFIEDDVVNNPAINWTGATVNSLPEK